MPSTIIGNTDWNTKGIILSRQSAQEQVNGLVNVQVQYAIPASKQYQIDRMFYVDAPPPIWPTVVNRAEMLTNNLYMVDRSIDRGNGIVTVSANYASGLQRAGSKGYFLRTHKQSNKSGLAYLRLVTIDGVAVNPLTAVDETDRGFRLFTFDLITVTAEFVVVGNATATQLPEITRNDLMQVPPKTSAGLSPQALGDVTTYTSEMIYNAPIVVVNGESYWRGDLANIGVSRKTTDRDEYITPIVKVVHREFFL